MKKRLLSILFTLAVCVGLLSVTALATDDGHTHGYDDSGFSTGGDSVTYQPATLVTAENYAELGLTESYLGYYAIANAGQLYWFAGLVNGDASVCVGDVTKNTAANAVLMNDITVNTEVLNEDGTVNTGEQSDDGTSTVTFRTWTPIGDTSYTALDTDNSVDASNAYAGTFDGRNHTISGLYLNNAEGKNDCALFGMTTSGAQISNLTVADSYFGGRNRVAGVCARNNGSITNCTNRSTVSSSVKTAGGICGWNDSGTITGCTNSGAVGGPKYIGGVCGYNDGTITGCTNSGNVSGTGDYTGGVCGFNSSIGKTENCRNEGTVSGKYFTGGVCGYNNKVNNNIGTITGCTNSGTVIGTGIGDVDVGGVCGKNVGAITGCTNYGTVTGTSYSTGGVCGKNEGAITNCTNSGTVSGTTYTGGVCGYNGGTITNCTNTNSGTVTGTGNYTGGVCGVCNGIVTNCANSGTVSGKSDTGGVSGLNYGGTITNCTNTGAVTGTGSRIGGVCGYNNRYYDSEGTITNCYFNSDAYSGNAVGGTGSSGATVDDVEGKTAAQFASGEVAWLLNGSTADGTPVWRQNLENGSTPDAYPLPVGTEDDSTGIVYQIKVGSCKEPTTQFSNSNVDNVNHVLTKVSEVPATCTTDGKKEYQHCSDCEKNFIEGVEKTDEELTIPAGHTPGEWAHDSTQHWRFCTVCEAELDRENHTFSGSTCTMCGYSMPIIPVTPTYPPVVTQPAEGGAVTVWPQAPAQGVTVTITPKPEDGYEVGSVTVTDRSGNALEVTDNGNGTYSFTQPAGAVTVNVTFADKTQLAFTDVSADAYYYDAVQWAVKNGITCGTSDTTFSPDASCTRAQMAAFLWRAAGCPEPKGTSSFTDVPSDAYYAKAVAWAVENGITGGVGNDKFAPDDVCTRAQMAAFLCRLAGGKAEGAGTFTDVSADAYYAEAVQWAVENGITDGVGDNRFAPDATCTRAQIVTFLYRFFVK